MDLSTIAVDLDGTLRNHLLFGVVLLYSALLACGTVAVGVAFRRTGRLRIAALLLIPVMVGAYIWNVAAVRAIVALIVEASAKPGITIDVGFFGHHPAWLAPTIGAFGAMGLLVAIGRIRKHRPQVSLRPLERSHPD